MFDKEFDIAEIIALSQKQKLAANDELLLRKWLEADAANPVLFASLSSEDSIREKMKAFEKPDSKTLWNNVINKLAIRDTQVKPTVRRLWTRIAVAAAAVAAITVGVWFYNSESGVPEVNSGLIVGLNDVAPGKQGATLTLTNGKKIKLSEVANGELAKEAGVVITKSADGQLVYEIKENSPESSQINTLSTAKGETYQVKLPDGSLVYLNAASSLTYPASFAALTERRVKLSGEGYFEIAKDKAHPFIVESDRQSIKVLGTHFNVDSYSDEPISRTTLIEGSVMINNGPILKPGQQARAIANERIEIVTADTDKVIAWKDGRFMFQSEPIESIMRKLARWYNVEVVYQDDVRDIPFTAFISRYDNISKILDKITYTQNIHFKIEGRRITVMR